MSYITSIGTAVPLHKFKQEAIADFMCNYLDADQLLTRQISILYKKSAIETRHSVIGDFALPKSERSFFNGHVPNVGERMATFQKEAPTLAIKAIQNAIAKNDDWEV
ncbi:MAG: type III polyketide synthase, partial [Bacteroidetes bacterium]|nr:type III polyketide synthase [Bacteroidota bacterium]